MTLQDEIIYLKNKGCMPANLILVDSHALDIPQKLRAVEPVLYIMYNPNTDKYEIHRRGFDNSLELNLPYRELDNRAVIAFVNGMDIKRMGKEIEAHNEKLRADQENKTKDEIGCKLRDMHTYCLRHVDKEKPDEKAYTARFV